MEIYKEQLHENQQTIKLMIFLIGIVFILTACNKDSKEFQKAETEGTIEAYENYIKNYPKSLNVDKAKNIIDSIKYNFAEAENKILQIEDFIQRNPSSRFIEEAKDRIRAIKGKVLFVSDRDGNNEIYSIDLNGENAINLSQNPANDYNPNWSPNGKHIAFTSGRTGNQKIYLMDYNGSNQKQLIVNSGTDPSFAPDGQHIAYSSEDDIFIYNLIDSTSRNITNRPNITDFQPTWSPGGKYICYSSIENGETLNLYIMDNTGKNIKQLTENSGFNHSPHWSPDGKKIIYISSKPITPIKNPVLFMTEGNSFYIMEKGKGFPSLTRTQNDLVAIDNTGNNKEILLSNSNNIRTPCWLKNGKQILFTMGTKKNDDIYILNMKNKNDISRLTSNNKNDYLPDAYPIIY